MAQSILLPTPSLPSYTPTSPDPTPLRLLAFSVAEAALQQDPNSPSLAVLAQAQTQTREHDPRVWGSGADWSGPWAGERKADKEGEGRKPLWDVVERAKERRERVAKPSPARSTSTLPPSPPVSPASYNFTLPSNSPLAMSIAASTPRAYATPPPSLSLSLSPDDHFSHGGRPLFTRSAEPSPTKSTFSALDQSRPPPEFVPRPSPGKTHARTKSDVAPPSDEPKSHPRLGATLLPSRHTTRLPSLQQIQAKMAKAQAAMSIAHRRGVQSAAVPHLPRLQTSSRTSSSESVEILKTPEDELPARREPRIVLNTALLNRRPSSPDSPANAVPQSAKEGRLAPFLRERTSGRLASGGRPLSMPPLRGNDLGPMLLKLTPPSSKSTLPSVPSPRCTTPVQTRFLASDISRLSTPPPRAPSPASSTSSPTLSVPIITCTPAPARVVREGVEQDSDEEEGEVVVFDGGVEDEQERERRGKEMRDRLGLRRKSG